MYVRRLSGRLVSVRLVVTAADHTKQNESESASHKTVDDEVDARVDGE